MDCLIPADEHLTDDAILEQVYLISELFEYHSIEAGQHIFVCGPLNILGLVSKHYVYRQGNLPLGQRIIQDIAESALRQDFGTGPE